MSINHTLGTRNELHEEEMTLSTASAIYASLSPFFSFHLTHFIFSFFLFLLLGFFSSSSFFSFTFLLSCSYSCFLLVLFFGVFFSFFLILFLLLRLPFSSTSSSFISLTISFSPRLGSRGRNKRAVYCPNLGLTIKAQT